MADGVCYAALLDLLDDRSYPVEREELASDHLEAEDGGARRGSSEADVFEALLKDHVPQQAGAVVRRLPCHRMLRNIEKEVELTSLRFQTDTIISV